MGAWFLCPSWIYQCVYVILLLLTGHQAAYLACKKRAAVCRGLLVDTYDLALLCLENTLVRPKQKL